MSEVNGILLVRHNFLEVDNVFVVELLENLNFSHSCDGKALLLVLQPHFLQGNHFIVCKEQKL